MAMPTADSLVYRFIQVNVGNGVDKNSRFDV
jgi:hypothetical protein